MNPIAIGALAGGALLVYHEATKHEKAAATVSAANGHGALDPGMDAFLSQAVAMAIQSETDATILSEFANKLKAAGFPNSAAAVAAKKGT